MTILEDSMDSLIEKAEAKLLTIKKDRQRNDVPEAQANNLAELSDPPLTETEKTGWHFIDRRKEVIRIEQMLKTHTLEHLHPVLRSLAKMKLSGQPQYQQAMAALDRLAIEAPNCAQFLELVQSQLHLHRYTQTTAPLRLLPTLLIGPPGVGKTFIVRQLAEVLNMYHDRISLSNATESFVLSGCPRGYSTTTPGEVAEKLAFSDIINPILVLDELDKASFQRSDRATIEGPLLTLLEPETAAHFEDACLRMTIDVSHVSWIATANSLDLLPEPLLNRFVVIQVCPLSQLQYQRLLDNQIRQLLAEMGLHHKQIRFSSSVEGTLRQTSIRSLRTALRIAIAKKLMADPLSHVLEITENEILLPYDHNSRKKPLGFY